MQEKRDKNQKFQKFLCRNFFTKNSTGQIWVETVIYTLIALIMIGAILAFAVPKVSEVKDKTTIEQSINLIKDINEVIISVVQGGLGNKRIIEVNVKRGELLIDGKNEEINFTIETDYVYSEPDKQITLGNVNAITERTGGTYKVTLNSEYGYDIKYDGDSDGIKTLTQSTTPYKLSIENKDKNSAGKIIVEINLI
ncbi:hypothetical protein HY449_04525 [Candidatus Pacearchaeota archaeon]|nr:hypothetical protein [Candidatus Pacearchaeota archaeon]